VPRRASGHRDGGAIALDGSFWEIIGVTRFSEYQRVSILRKYGYTPRGSETGAPSQKESMKLPN
jgi:hypothetical protein